MGTIKKKAIISLSIFLSFFITSCGNNNLTVDNVWARPGFKGDNSAVYFVIDNPTNDPDVLVSVESDIAEAAEIHMSKMDEEGKMVMEHQESVEIEPQTQINFQPGGLHVMLVNLQGDLNLGDEFKLVLNFQSTGSMQVDVLVSEP